MQEQPRNKAKLRDGAIVEYDEAMGFDPANPEPRKPKVRWEAKYLGSGKIINPSGDESERLYHFWEYLNAPKPMQGIRSLEEVRFSKITFDGGRQPRNTVTTLFC